MKKKISEIYTEYKIMPNLQEHMFRVAAVASMICDNFDEPIQKEEIITSCLLHDMGNIVKFNLEYFPEFNKPEGIEYWQNVQNEFRNKYGNEDHAVNGKIAREMSLNNRIVELIDSISFFGASENAMGKDFGKKIVEYCDDRVGPLGILSIEERIMDLRKRYVHHGDNSPLRQAFENAIRQMEKQIFAKCKIKPEDINDETVAPIVSELKNFVIK